MSSTDRTVLLGLTLLTTSVGAFGVTAPAKTIEYSVISERNPFGLVDPPKPAPVLEPDEKNEEATPPPNIDLTGFFRNSRKGKTVALFLVEEKEGGKATKQSYMWAEGEGDKGMKVLEINEGEESVRLSVRGVESTITFSKPKAAAPPKVVPIPGRPNLRTPAVPTASDPHVNPGAQQYQNARSGRFGRASTTSSAVGGGLPTQSAGGAGNTLQSIPSRNMRVSPNSSQFGGQTRLETLTAHEQEVLIEVNRAVNQQTGAIQPPLPPTSLTTPEDRARILVPPAPPGGQ